MSNFKIAHANLKRSKYLAITKTLYRTAPHWGKVKYRTAEDFRTLPNFTKIEWFIKLFVY